MSDYTAVPYRTPACDRHLPDNASDECPWCRIEELENESDDLSEKCAYFARQVEALERENEQLLQDIDRLVKSNDGLRHTLGDKRTKVEELEKARDYHIASVGKVVKESRAEIEALEAKADRYHSALAVIYANPHEPQAAQIAENSLYDVEDTDASNNR